MIEYFVYLIIFEHNCVHLETSDTYDKVVILVFLNWFAVFISLLVRNSLGNNVFMATMVFTSKEKLK